MLHDWVSDAVTGITEHATVRGVAEAEEVVVASTKSDATGATSSDI